MGSIKVFGFIVKTCNASLLHALEPWCSTIYIEDDMQVLTIDYFEKEKNNTLYDLSERIKPYDNEKNNINFTRWLTSVIYCHYFPLFKDIFQLESEKWFSKIFKLSKQYKKNKIGVVDNY